MNTAPVSSQNRVTQRSQLVASSARIPSILKNRLIASPSDERALRALPGAAKQTDMPNFLTLDDDRRALALQFMRYGLTGGFLTILAAGLYWVLATPFHYAPQTAINLAYLLAVVLGYFLHGAFSFKGHGSSDSRSLGQSLRFFAVSLVSLGLNKFFVWLFTAYFAGPTWWPIPAIVFVTPVVVFTLNRKWVYG